MQIRIQETAAPSLGPGFARRIERPYQHPIADYKNRFQGTPLKKISSALTTKGAAEFLANHNLTQDYVMALASNTSDEVVSFKPSRVDPVSDKILRIWFDTTPDSIKQLEAFVAKAKAAPLTLIFANYGSIPGLKETQTPIAKRTTYFLHAKGGVEFVPGKDGDNTVVFKNVTRATALNDYAQQKPFTNGDLAKAIGTKGAHSFTPNGVFHIMQNGKSVPVVLEFDAAHFNPKTNELVFRVGFLQPQNPEHSPSDVVVPDFFMKGEPTTIKESVTLFLDWAATTGHGWE